VFAGVLIVRLVHVRPAAWLPILAMLWFAIYFTRAGKIGELISASIGTLSGWWAYVTLLG
jgi:hypothetical protein